MKNKMTISIVTPSFNQGEYIEETIKSVISQAGDFFIDYIVMDGGSSDNSVEIIKEIDELIKTGKWKPKCLGIEFRWVSEKDKGQTHAINKGFRIAKGEIVSWLNSDDMYFDGTLSVVAEHFREHPEDDFIFGDGDVVDEHGNLQWEWLSRPYDYKLLKSYHFLWNDFTNYIMQQATFWKRDIFKKIGFLNESLHYAMDIEYWLRIGNAHLKSVHLPCKLGKFRMITGTKSLSSPTVFWPESLEIFLVYNGPKAMEPFLKYYFYNEGLHNDFDLNVMTLREKGLFEKWSHLSDIELSILKDKSAKGYAIACLMLAYEAFLMGEPGKANKIFKAAVNDNRLLIFHYRALYYCVSKTLGRNLSIRMRKGLEKLFQAYRMRKYLYRYLRQRKELSRPGMENAEGKCRGSLWTTIDKLRKKLGEARERDVRELDEKRAVKYLVKKYETNRKYTTYFLKHMVVNHKNNPQFDLYIESELGSLKRSRAFIKSLSDEIGNSNLFLDKECLDIGSSAGNSLIAFIENGVSRATGIELCEGRYQTSLINMDGFSNDVKSKIQIINEDIQNQKIMRIGQFDIIFCNDVLEHVKSPLQTVEHICKLLKNTSGAFAYVNLRNYQNPENVLHEPHYNLPGMVLLPHESAKNYFNSCRQDNSLEYEVFHWKSFYEYQQMFEAFGKKCEFYGKVSPDLSGINHIKRESDKILPNFKVFSDEKHLDHSLRQEIEECITDYLLKMRHLAHGCRSTNDEQLMKNFYLNYVIFDINMLISNKESENTGGKKI